MASIKDVSKLAGVSLMTVSRAINTPEKVRPATLAKINDAIKALNYTPDYSAQKCVLKAFRDTKIQQ